MSTAVLCTNPHGEIFIFDDYAVHVARRIVTWCSAMISQQACVHVGLTGGNTARRVYEALGQAEVRGDLDVKRINFYQGDERPVPASSPDSNWGMAEQAFLDPAGVPAENRHRMNGEAADLHQAAGEYEAVLCGRLPRNGDLPAFDLLLLGVGADGHVASLFPGTAAMREMGRLVVANPVPEIQTTRLTITLPMINAARAVWLLVSGVHKAETVRRAVELRDQALPVVHVAPLTAPVTWLLDHDAAAKLSPASCRRIHV